MSSDSDVVMAITIRLRGLQPTAALANLRQSSRGGWRRSRDEMPQITHEDPKVLHTTRTGDDIHSKGGGR